MTQSARILIVDDEPAVAGMIELILNAGQFHHIDCARSAAEAFDLLGLDEDERSLPGYDVILLDIMMPEIDGIETCARIRTCRRYRDTPILVISGMWNAETVNQAFLAGAHDYLTKPVNRIELIARIHAALRLKRELDRRHAIEQRLSAILRRYEGLHRPGDPQAVHDFSFRLAAAALSGRLHSLLAIRLAPDADHDAAARALEAIEAPLGWTLTDCGAGEYLILAPDTGEEAMREAAGLALARLRKARPGDEEHDMPPPPAAFACVEAVGNDILAAPARLATMIEHASATGTGRFARFRRAA